MTIRYQQVARELEKRIRNGDLAEGDQLPSEAKLSDEFGISTPTIRAALDVLQAKNLIRKMHGKGNYVQHRLPRITYGHTPAVRSQNHKGVLQVDVQAQEVVADHEVAAFMRIVSGAPLVRYTYLSRREDVPYALALVWIPPDLAVQDTRDSLAEPWADDVTAALQRAGIKLVSKSERLTVGNPSAEEAGRLAVTQHSSVMVIERHLTDVMGRVVQGARFIVPGDRGEAVYQTSYVDPGWADT